MRLRTFHGGAGKVRAMLVQRMLQGRSVAQLDQCVARWPSVLVQHEVDRIDVVFGN
jgi:hypothetical protein